MNSFDYMRQTRPTLLIAAAILGTAALNEYPVALAQDIGTPRGYLEFCGAQAPICAPAEPAPLPDGSLGEVIRINTQVNAAIDYHYGGPDGAWDVAPILGDCRDYAATKLVRLVGAGIPRHALRFAAALTPDDQPHLVLILETRAGPLVLDNRTDRILTVQASGLRIVAVEDPARGAVWRIE